MNYPFAKIATTNNKRGGDLGFPVCSWVKTKHMQLPPYRDRWSENDPHANFKAEVANYTVVDPLPTLDNLSHATGIPTPCLIRYVLVKWAASGAEALLEIPPIVLTQMQEHLERAEAEGTDEARLKAYDALRQMVAWLKLSPHTDDG